MKTEFTDRSETRKELAVEIPTGAVTKAIDRLARRYSRSVKIPGFRPGKVPAKLVRTRFRDQILHDVAQDLIPHAVDDALREHGVQPVATPEIRDVEIEEGKPLTFTAAFETVPPVDPGNYDGFTLRRTPAQVGDDAVDKALEQMRQGAAKSEPVEGRAAERGDTVTLDLDRWMLRQPAAETAPAGKPERHENVAIEIGSPANPPGFDEHLVGLETGAEHEFTLTYPDTHEVPDLAGAEVRYVVAVKAINRQVLPALDDEFAKDLGKFDTLAGLRERVQSDLENQAERDADREVRNELLKQLATRVTVEVPEALIKEELDRRVEHFARHLIAQRIDPRRAAVDWDALRSEQRPAATDAVRSALVIDEIAKREVLEVTDDDVEQELARQAELTGRTVSAVRALMEKEGGVGTLTTGLRREKAIDLLLARATIVTA